MKTIEIKLYSFSELSKEAQQKVIDKHCDINIIGDWWSWVFEDATEIGLRLDNFYMDQIFSTKGVFIIDAIEVAEKIFENHGKEANTYKIAERFKEQYYQPNAIIEDRQSDFLALLLNEYANILQKEYEHITSDKAVIENIEANEYTFEQDGTMRND